MRKTISNKILKEFAIVIGLGFPIIFGLIFPFFRGHSIKIWTLWFGLSFLTVGFLYPKILFYPYKGWMALGHVLGWINSRIILGLIFFIILLPISLIMRIFGYNPLEVGNKKVKTYRKVRLNDYIDLKRIF